MTATPRIYDDSTKTKAGEANAILASMDDEELFGPEFHRLGFGEAVERGLLTDYKVLVLTVDEESVARTFQTAALRRRQRAQARRRRQDRRLLERPRQARQRRALLRARPAPDAPRDRLRGQHQGLQARSRNSSSRVTDYYVGATDQENDDGTSPLKCSVQHVDGTMNALERNRKLDWLKEEPAEGQLPDPHQRALPLRGRRCAGARRGDVPLAAQVGRRHRPVRRPRHAPGQEERQAVRLHHPADRRPVAG